jgi:hypothetical protein
MSAGGIGRKLSDACDGFRGPAYLSDGFLLFALSPVEIFVGIAQADACGHDSEAAPGDSFRRLTQPPMK